MRRLAAALVLWGGAAAAEPCAELQEAVLALAGDAGVTVEDAGTVRAVDGGCVSEGLMLRTGGATGFHLEVPRIGWSAEGVGPGGMTGGAIRVALTVEGLRYWPVTGLPQVDWMQKQMLRRATVDARLQVGWEPDTGRVSLPVLEVDLPGPNGVSLALELDGILPERMMQSATLPPVTLHEFRLDLRNEGFFDGMVLSLLMAGEDPAAAVVAIQAQARGIVAVLPDETFPASTKESMTALIDGMPVPWGRVALSVETADGVPLDLAARLLLFGEVPTVPDLAQIADAAKLRLSFEPWQGWAE